MASTADFALVNRLRELLKPYFLSFDGTRDLGRGTSFPLTADIPGGLQVHDRFFRTDLDLPCFYDGGRWVTQQLFTQFLCSETSFTASALATPVVQTRMDYVPYWTHIAINTQVQTTNNGSNFWTISLQSINLAATSNDNLIIFNTSADAVNTRVDHSATPSVVIPGFYPLLRFTPNKTGSPGTLFLEATGYHRLIVP